MIYDYYHIKEIPINCQRQLLSNYNSKCAELVVENACLRKLIILKMWISYILLEHVKYLDILIVHLFK